MKKDFQRIFSELKSIMSSFSDELLVVKDFENEYYLDTHYVYNGKAPLFFGAVKINKNFVSYYLMPIYTFPELLDNIEPELRKKLKGKSCFHITRFDRLVFDEIAKLTKKGFEKYKETNYI